MIKAENIYARMGMAAMIPGLQRAAELLSAEVAKFRALLDDDGTTERQIENVTASKRGGGGSSWHKAYWAKMTPEQKLAEMKRRGMTVGKPRKTGTGKYWDKFTPEERRKEMARRIAVRKGGAASKMGEAKLEEKRRRDREAAKRKRDAARAAKAQQ